jgi:hypothetical protein
MSIKRESFFYSFSFVYKLEKTVLSFHEKKTFAFLVRRSKTLYKKVAKVLSLYKNKMASDNGQWYWNGNSDPFDKDQSPQWTPYNEEDNNLIEQSFKSQASKVDLKNYVIHFAQFTQFHKYDNNKQRQVKREPK